MKSKVVIFGAWKKGVLLYFEIMGKDEVVAFCDNNQQLWGQSVYDKKILRPEELLVMQYDYIYIASDYKFGEIYAQLRMMGIERNKIKIMAIQSNVEHMLTVYEENESLKEMDYESKWLELKSKYKQISIYKLDTTAIGEIVLRIQAIVEDKKNNNPDELRVIVPDLGNEVRICNKKLFDLARDIDFVTKEDIGFWKWVLKNHFYEISIENFNKYIYRNFAKPQIMKKENIPFSFTEEQIKLGEENMSKMGIKGEFVCMAARSSNYAKSTIKNSSTRDWNIRAHEYRNADFLSYSSTIKFLKEHGLQAVRMGRGEAPISKIDNCIDYAGLYADDFMDFFLLSKCKFMVTGTTGIFAVAAAFAKPVLMVNVACGISVGGGGMKYTENDMYIPKKYYDISQNAYLSLREVSEIENRDFDNGLLYEQYGIKLKENSKEEIRDAVEEMMLRMEGKWRDSEEDIKYYNKYKKIIKEVNKNSEQNKRNWLGEGIPYRICSCYLRNNLYLLE